MNMHPTRENSSLVTAVANHDKTMVRRSMGATRRMSGIISILLGLFAVPVEAQTFTTLLSFSGSDGAEPAADLTPVGSTLYGTASAGGSLFEGTIFSVPAGGGSPSILHSFSGSDGATPKCSLTLSGSTFYGTTYTGGANNDGTVFSIPAGGGPIATLSTFNGSNGNGPRDLTLDGSYLYGTTYSGGQLGYGTIFRVPLLGGSPTTLFNFDNTHGAAPDCGLTLVGTNLYGMTFQGGTYGAGAIFSIPENGGTPNVLFSFNPISSGFWAIGHLLNVGSKLYGMASAGGPNNVGTIFSIPLAGGTPTILHSFNGTTDDAFPKGGLTLCGSTFYGMTSGGVVGNAPRTNGSIFRINLDGTGFRTLLTLSNTTGPYFGMNPWGDLTLSGSSLYGTTFEGSANGMGTVFALNIAPATIVLSSSANGAIIRGGTAGIGATLSNAPTSGYSLNYTLTAAVLTGSASLGAVTPSAGSLAPGLSRTSTVQVTSASPGITTLSFTASDPNSSNLSQTATAALTVLDHAAAAFSDGSSVLNLSFGTVSRGWHALQFQLQNLPGAYRAGLDLDSLWELADANGLFSTDAAGFSDLTAGAQSGLFRLILNDTTQDGQVSGEYQFNLSDEKDLSGHAGQQTLILNVTATVVPEPPTLGLVAAGIFGLVGCLLMRKERHFLFRYIVVYFTRSSRR